MQQQFWQRIRFVRWLLFLAMAGAVLAVFVGLKVRSSKHIVPAVRLYSGPYLHEAALRFDRPVAPVLETLAAQDILGGYDLTESAGTDALLVCATETKSDADIDRCIAAFAEAMRA